MHEVWVREGDFEPESEAGGVVAGHAGAEVEHGAVEGDVDEEVHVGEVDGFGGVVIRVWGGNGGWGWIWGDVGVGWCGEAFGG